GLYTATMLAELEEQFGDPIAAHFDLIAGTSIGGILALGLAAETPAAKIRDLFEEHGEAIFYDRPVPKSRPSRLRDLWRSFNKPKYQSSALKDTINAVLSEGTKIGDLPHRVIIPAVNLTKGQPQLFKTPHHEDFRRDYKLAVVD